MNSLENSSRVTTLQPEAVWAILILLVVFLLYVTWLRTGAKVPWFLVPRKNPKKSESKAFRISHPKLDFAKLKAHAIQTVTQTVESLPPELKGEADQIVTVYLPWSDKVYEPDVLGVYDGYESDRVGGGDARITLFLGNLTEFCREEGLDFEEEVKKTWLHEFGHHLGYDEGALEERGLG